MSPAEIHILLNHYALSDKSYEACGNGMAPDFYDKTVKKFESMGLLDYGEVTPMGKKFVEMLCDTPMPILSYQDPRTL